MVNTNPLHDLFQSVWARLKHRGWLLPLLLSLMACGSSVPGTPVPTGLRGQWETILTSVPTYYPYPEAPSTIPGSSSLGIIYYFYPDGRYEHIWNMMMVYYNGNCFRTQRWSESGTVSIAGADYTFKPSKARLSVLDSCDKAVYLDPAPAKSITVTLTPDQDQAGWPLLHFGFPTGEDIVLEKCRKCG